MTEVFEYVSYSKEKWLYYEESVSEPPLGLTSGRSRVLRTTSDRNRDCGRASKPGLKGSFFGFNSSFWGFSLGPAPYAPC
jgi:hypothetical protein